MQRITIFPLLFALAGCAQEPRLSVGPSGESPLDEPPVVRVGLFNVKEMRKEKIKTVDEGGVGAHPQLKAAAAIIQRFQPDVLVLNEIDHGTEPGETLDGPVRRFAELYLSSGEPPLDYAYFYAAPNNTGRLSGLDLDGDGHAATDADRGERRHGNDSWGYGTYPGEYSMAVLSRLPLAGDSARTFQTLRWSELPGHHMPPNFFPADIASALRLSSKSHQDVGVDVEGRELRLLLSHPTPPGFDGDEDKNGRRNFDEIKLWADYLDPAFPLRDDAGVSGGLDEGVPFVIAGDLNAAPGSDQAFYDGIAAIDQLLEHPRVLGSIPQLDGVPTAVFGEGTRIDYLLPSREIQVVDGGVFWPDLAEDPEGARLAEQASDHRFVWLDLRLPKSP